MAKVTSEQLELLQSRIESLQIRIDELKEQERNRVIPFGKYHCKTLGFVRDNDPDYIDWLASNTDFPICYELLDLLPPIERRDEEIKISKSYEDHRKEMREFFARMESECKGNCW
mgnify:CR=1 FL=1